jgi:hypothetical protein
MAQATGTYSSYDAKGNREDLIDKIFDISPTDCPVTKAIGTSTAKSTKHDWQTDSLAAASADNAVIEGDEYSYSAPSATTRVQNYTQIFRKTFIVSGTQESVNKAGRSSEVGYQAAKKSKEIKRDLEASVCSNNASVAGNDTTARKMGGLRAWIETNDVLGVAGSPASGGYNSGTGVVDAATDGTARAFTKALLDTAIKSAYDNGGEPSMISLGSFNKQVFSGFMADSAVAQQRRTVDGNSQATITAAADVYVSDFGSLVVKANRFQRSRDALILDPEYASVAVLRKMKVDKPAKTGDAIKYAVIHECTLRVDNEAAHACVADLTDA